MGRRDELIEKYAQDIRDKLGEEPDMELLKKVVIGLGPSIYNADAETVAGSDPKELERVRQNFLVRKLGLTDVPANELDAAIDEVIARYGRSNRNKYRPVIYYMLVKKFGKESVYG